MITYNHDTCTLYCRFRRLNYHHNEHCTHYTSFSSCRPTVEKKMKPQNFSCGNAAPTQFLMWERRSHDNDNDNDNDNRFIKHKCSNELL